MEYKMKVVDIYWEDYDGKEIDHLPEEVEITYNEQLLEEYGDLDTLAGEVLNEMFDGYRTFDYCVF